MPLVSTGQITIVDTNDGLSSELSKSSLIVPADSTGAVASFAGVDTTMKVYLGGVNDSANWTFYVSAIGAGITYRDSDDAADRTGTGATNGLITGTTGYVKVMSLTTDGSFIELTATRVGFPTLVRRFDVVKSKAGAAGTNGINGSDAISMVLSSEAITLAADAAGNVSSYTGAVTTAKVMKGLVDDTANWTFTRIATNCTSTSSGTPAGVTQTISAMTADVAYVDITATRAGHATQTKRLTINKARSGAKGDGGLTGPRGTVQLARAITASAWSDAEAAAALTAAGYGAAVSGDVVTLYNTTTKFSEARVFSGGWLALASYINGNMLVDGTVVAAKIVADGLTIWDAGHTVKILDAGGTDWTSRIGAEPTQVFNNHIDASWWSPTGTFLWTKNEHGPTVETTIVQGQGYNGVMRPLVKCVADAYNKVYTPQTGTPGLTGYWFPGETQGTGVAATAIVDATGGYTTTAGVYSGNAFKITKTATSVQSMGIASRAVAVTPGQVLRIRARVRAGVAASAGLFVRVNQAATMPATGAVNATNRIAGAAGYTDLANNGAIGTTYTTYENLNYTVPAGVNAISLSVFSWLNGPVDLWLDDPTINLASAADNATGPREANDGGWGTTGAYRVPVDPTKTYRFMVPVYRETPTSLVAQCYWGPEGNLVCGLNTTTPAANPYFIAGPALPASGIWYMLVGYVYPAGSTGRTNVDAGVYRIDTGQKVLDGFNYCWAASTTAVGHRAFQFYADIGATQWFDSPMIHVVDGSEPPLRSFFSDSSLVTQTNPINATNAGSFIANKGIPGVKIGAILASDDFNGTVDANGNILNKGTVGWAISKGGKIVGRDADLSGNITANTLNAATGTFTGQLSGATGTFSGSLAAGVLDLTKLTGMVTAYGPGTYTITVPADYTSLRLTLIGGGGGGGSNNAHNNGGRGGGGGGAGQVVIQTFTGLTPGATYTLVVGVGGSGGLLWASGNGQNGTATSVSGLATALAGSGGTSPVPNVVGVGGAGYPAGANGGDLYVDPEGGAVPGNGGNGGSTSYGAGGVGGQWGYTNFRPPGHGEHGTGYGSGGGGGGGYNAGGGTGNFSNGGNGAPGRAIVEFFNPNSVVVRSEWNALITKLAQHGITYP